MKKKNHILTISIRKIKLTFNRFVSLLIMSLLGVGVFVGIKSTSTNMIISLDSYYDDYNMYDINIKSANGLTNSDISELEKISGIKDVEGSFSIDCFIELTEVEYIMKVISLPQNINQLRLIEGNLPKNNNEILVEARLLKYNDIKIGDYITLDSSSLVSKEYKIVGTIDSPLYIGAANGSLASRGATSLGNGTINYYCYIDATNFNFDYYIDIYITVENSKKMMTSSSEYDELIEAIQNRIKQIASTQEDNRYNEIYTNMNQAINDAEEEFTSQVKIYNDYLQQYEITENEISTKLQGTQNSLNEVIERISSTDINAPEYEELGALKNQLETDILILKTLNAATPKIAEARIYIDSLKEQLKNFVKGNWYILNRFGDSTYDSYIKDTNSISNLAALFPTIFFIVAILISLISMSRMVEEERMQIGTLKSLGFSNKSILLEYMMYAFIATLLGGIIGAALGSWIIPKLIWNIYEILFTLPKFILKFNYKYTIIGTAIALLCICGATMYTALSELRTRPAQLMRPKSPKKGKKVFLEKVPFIWNKLNFSKKVTIRNIIRYKKRVIMTSIGVLGCTALMLSGFGLRDSIVDIPKIQFNDIFNYDDVVNVNPNTTPERLQEIFSNENIENYVETKMETLRCDNIDINLFIPKESSDISLVVNLKDLNSEKTLELQDDEVIITDKLAQLLSLEKGDNISFKDFNDRMHTFKIYGIVENYVNHYVYMTKSTYENNIGEYKTNIVYLNIFNLSKAEEEQLATNLLLNDEVLTVSLIVTLLESVDDMLGSLNYVVLILIVLSAMLSFVIFYNLSNININERKREIATLKVLGFYNSEVDSYITKENFIITFFGIILGLILGYFLTNKIIDTVEVDIVRFIHKISWQSYLYSSIITIVFTAIVAFVTHFSLKKIDMIESLKSVE